MFGNAKWFSMRKYGGWGLTPNCWQGWIYLAIIIIPFTILSTLKLPGMTATYLQFVWGGIFALDFIFMITKIKKDERETIHEAIAERNAMWFVIIALVIGLAYQVSVGAVKQDMTNIDPIILIALMGAVLIKAATHIYLRDK